MLYLKESTTPNVYLSESFNTNTIFYTKIEGGAVIINESIKNIHLIFHFHLNLADAIHI